MSRLSLGTCLSNLKSVYLTILEQLAFDAQKFRGHVALATPPFQNILRDHVRTVPGPGNRLVKFEVCSFECIVSYCISNVKVLHVIFTHIHTS